MEGSSMAYLRVLFVSIIFFEMGCTTISTKNSQLSLETLEKLQYGVFTEEAAVAAFGTPDKMITALNMDIWYYKDPKVGFSRAHFFFDEKDKKLKSTTWVVWNGEKEQEMEFVKKHYSSDFQKQPEDKKPHNIPTDVFYSSPKTGIDLVFNQYRKQVFYIMIGKPRSDKDSVASN